MELPSDDSEQAPLNETRDVMADAFAVLRDETQEPPERLDAISQLRHAMQTHLSDVSTSSHDDLRVARDLPQVTLDDIQTLERVAKAPSATTPPEEVAGALELLRLVSDLAEECFKTNDEVSSDPRAEAIEAYRSVLDGIVVSLTNVYSRDTHAMMHNVDTTVALFDTLGYLARDFRESRLPPSLLGVVVNYIKRASSLASLANESGDKNNEERILVAWSAAVECACHVVGSGVGGKYFPITTFLRLIAHTRLTFLFLQSGDVERILRTLFRGAGLGDGGGVFYGTWNGVETRRDGVEEGDSLYYNSEGDGDGVDDDSDDDVRYETTGGYSRAGSRPASWSHALQRMFTASRLDTMSYEELLEMFGPGNAGVKPADAGLVGGIPIAVVGENKQLRMVKLKHASEDQNKTGRENIQTLRCDSCCVCLEPWGLGDLTKTLTLCGHTFHANCIDRWLTKERNACPVCRRVGVEETKGA